MTTHTPWDAKLRELEAKPRAVKADIAKEDAYFRGLLYAKAEGYRLAKAEDAPLLAAAEAALAIAEAAQGRWQAVLPPHAPDWNWTEPFKDIVESLVPAIAAAKEGAE